MAQDNSTEQRILDAARKIFTIKGYRGSTVEDITNEAKVNKASLHYYYRSKDKLFELIFDEAFLLVNNNIFRLINQNVDFEIKIELIIDSYIDILIKYPYLPDFIIHELSSNPKRIETITKSHKSFFKSYLRFQLEMRKELKIRNISNITPSELILNIISLCVFPFIGKPIISHISNSFEETHFNAMMEKRKINIANLILKSISK